MFAVSGAEPREMLLLRNEADLEAQRSSCGMGWRKEFTDFYSPSWASSRGLSWQGGECSTGVSVRICILNSSAAVCRLRIKIFFLFSSVEDNKLLF